MRSTGVTQVCWSRTEPGTAVHPHYQHRKKQITGNFLQNNLVTELSLNQCDQGYSDEDPWSINQDLGAAARYSGTVLSELDLMTLAFICFSSDASAHRSFSYFVGVFQLFLFFIYLLLHIKTASRNNKSCLNEAENPSISLSLDIYIFFGSLSATGILFAENPSCQIPTWIQRDFSPTQPHVRQLLLRKTLDVVQKSRLSYFFPHKMSVGGLCKLMGTFYVTFKRCGAGQRPQSLNV